jgi:predicted hotdog family 3-hydroxylacyl-ACP dehydratase
MNHTSARLDYPPIEELLPHRAHMLLVDRLIDCTEESVRAAHQVRVDAWYVDAGRTPAWIGIELMAQTVAAYVGYRKRLEGLPPAHGYLLGTRRFRSIVPAFASGSTLEIVAERQYQEPSGLGAFDCRIELDRIRVADATLTVFEPR